MLGQPQRLVAALLDRARYVINTNRIVSGKINHAVFHVTCLWKRSERREVRSERPEKRNEKIEKRK
jgi:hypothetical protein